MEYIFSLMGTNKDKDDSESDKQVNESSQLDLLKS